MRTALNEAPPSQTVACPHAYCLLSMRLHHPSLALLRSAALVKMRASTGVERLGSASPLFKPGQILDEVRAVDGSAVSIAFSYPDQWVLAGGPNLVRIVRESWPADVCVLSILPLTLLSPRAP
jgi:hypothetical protein